MIETLPDTPNDMANAINGTTQQAKEYIALLGAIRKAGSYDDENLLLIHKSIVATAQEQQVSVAKMAIAVLADFL